VVDQVWQGERGRLSGNHPLIPRCVIDTYRVTALIPAVLPAGCHKLNISSLDSIVCSTPVVSSCRSLLKRDPHDSLVLARTSKFSVPTVVTFANHCANVLDPGIIKSHPWPLPTQINAVTESGTSRKRLFVSTKIVLM